MQERFFNFHFGFVVVVQLEDDVRKTFEVRIDRSIECQLNVAGVKSALLRIMIADLDMIEIPRSRAGQSE